jgi:hypothetical protein
MNPWFGMDFPSDEEVDANPDDSDVRCKYCGQEGFEWHEVSPGKFRLILPNGGLHECPKYPHSPQGESRE